MRLAIRSRKTGLWAILALACFFMPLASPFAPGGFNAQYGSRTGPGFLKRVNLPPTRLILPDPLKPTSSQESQLTTRLVPWDVALSPDGKKLATSFLEPGAPLEVWESGNGGSIWTSSTSQGFLSFTPDGKFLVCGTRFGGNLVVYQADTGQEIFSIPSGTKILMAMKPTSDSKSVIVAGHDGQIVKIDLLGRRVASILRKASAKPAPEDFPIRVYTMDISPDGKELAIGLQVPKSERKGKGACCVAILDTQTGAILRRYLEEADDVHSVAFSPDGTMLAVHFNTVRADGVPDSWIVRLLEAKTGKLLRDVSRDISGNLVFSHDGRVLYGLRGSQFIGWDTRFGMMRRRLSDPEGFGKSLSVSVDGSQVATLSVDKASALLWRGQTGTGKPVNWTIDDLERIMQEMGRSISAADLEYLVQSRSLERQDFAAYDLARSPVQARQEIEKALRQKDAINNEYFATLLIEVLESIRDRDLMLEASKHSHPVIAAEAKSALSRMK